MTKKILKQICKNESGFSLMEVVVATAVFAIALLSLVQVFYYSTNLNYRAKQVSTAANLARREMDSIRMMSYNEIEAFVNNIANTGNPIELDANQDGTPDYEYTINIEKQTLAAGENYYRYIIDIRIKPRDWKYDPNSDNIAYLGPDVAYHLRTVMIRSTEDLNNP